MNFATDYPFTSRSACYGDGCFTTISVVNGHAELLSYHIRRLKLACERLFITVSEDDWTRLSSLISEKAVNARSGIIKVIISAGNAGRGYQRSADVKAECYLQVLPPVEHYSTWQKEGISLGVSNTTLAINPGFAGIKHLNRLEQVLIKETSQNGLQDSLVLDEQLMMVEVSAGNLFWKAFGRWFTPDLSLAGVEGVMRNHLLKVIAENKESVEIVRSRISALKQATDVFICNSLMGIVPINSVQLNQDKVLHFNNGNLPAITHWVEESLQLKAVKEHDSQ